MKTLSRRRLLFAAAPAALSLGGCARFNSIVSTVYTDLNKVAAQVESVAAQFLAAGKTWAPAVESTLVAAGGLAKDEFVPCCQVLVTLNSLAQQLVQAGVLKSSNPSVALGLQAAASLAGNPIIQAAAQTGAIPANPLTVIEGAIELVVTVMTATNAMVTPTKAVVTKA